MSTEERRSSVKEGTSDIKELRLREVCLGSRRRRRSLVGGSVLVFGGLGMGGGVLGGESLQCAVVLIGFCHGGGFCGGENVTRCLLCC